MWRRVASWVETDASCHLLTCCFLLKLFLRPWRKRRYVPLKRRFQLKRLHGVTSQKMILFITAAVKTSNPTQFYHYSNSLVKRYTEILAICGSLERPWRPYISRMGGKLYIFGCSLFGSRKDTDRKPIGTLHSYIYKIMLYCLCLNVRFRFERK
jgi:hypothetical protein